MKSLPIDKALQLYKLLSPYFSEGVGDDFNFVGTIIENIKNSGNYRDYTDAITLMTDIDFEQLKTMHPVNEVLPLFIDGLIENKILMLKDFCEKVGFHVSWQ